jgi:lipid II:glycine glycyltransferase (peptidoglycan interpeptide bridge formation enzyme)
LVIDLGSNNQALLNKMKAKTRYNINLAQKNNLRVEITDKLDQDIEKVLNGNSWRNGLYGMNNYWLRAELEAFGDKAFVVKVSDGRSLVATAIYLTSDTTVYYMQNGSTDTGRKLMAPTLAVWAGIEEGKRRGLKSFDFDGVSDERKPIKKWSGLTRFKEGFGGKAVYYPPALVQNRWPF